MPGQNGSAHPPGTYVPLPSAHSPCQALPGHQREHGGDAVVRGETGDQTGQESRSAGHRAAPSMIAMDIAIHMTFPPA